MAKEKKEKVVKKSKKVKEITEEKKVDEVKEVVVNDLKEENKDVVSSEVVIEEVSEQKVEKKKRFWDEVKSFLILVLIIALLIFGGWLFIKYAKPIEWDKNGNNNTPVVEESGPINDSLISYSLTSEGSLNVVGNKYLIEYDSDGYLYKIMDFDLNVIYESSDETYYSIYEGIDGKIYALEYFDLDRSFNSFFLYVLENDKLVQVNEFVLDDSSYNVILTEDQKIVGVHEQSCEDMVCEDETFINLNNEEFDISGKTFDSDGVRLDISQSYIIKNSKYIIFSEDDKYGIYDLEKGSVAVDASYDKLYAIKGNKFVAAKEDKYGIIDVKLKKLVDFEYDFIDVNDDYYVVGKNNKLAIMDKEYNLVTDFEFNFQSFDDEEPVYLPQLCCSNINTFASYKVGDKYVLTINNDEYYFEDMDYKKHETYIISSDGSYTTIEANIFAVYDDYAVAYLEDDKEIVVYTTKDFSVLYKIDISKYDIDEGVYSTINGDSLILDIASGLFFNVSDGIEKDDKIVTYTFGEISVVVDYEEENIVFKSKDETVTLDFDSYYGHTNSEFKKASDGSIYFYNDENFVKIG